MKNYSIISFIFFVLIGFVINARAQETATKYLNRYQAAMEMQDFEGAAEELLKALEIETKNVPAYYKLGQVYEKQNKYKEAVEAYKMYLEMVPGSIDNSETQKKIDMLEYKLERSIKSQAEKNFIFGKWRSDIYNPQTGKPWFVFDIIDNGGDYFVKMSNDCPGYSPDFISQTADAQKKGDLLVFSFSSDISVNPERDKQNEMQLLNSASSLMSGTEFGGVFGTLSTIAGAIPADAASNTVKTYVFIIKLNPKTNDLEGSYRETVKYKEQGKAPKITVDEIRKISLLKSFTGNKKKEYNDGRCIYEGDFVDSYRQGKGLMIWYDSLGNETLRYLGDWVKDRRDGKGKDSYSNGASFEGSFLNDEWSYGTYVQSDGVILKGGYINGKLSGNTRYTCPGKYYVEGLRKEGIRIGESTFSFNTGNSYLTTFDNGVMKYQIIVMLKDGQESKFDYREICSPKNNELFEKIKDDLVVIWYHAGNTLKSNEDKFKYQEQDLKLLFMAKLSIEPDHYLYNMIEEALVNFPESLKRRTLISYPTVCSLLKSL